MGLPGEFHMQCKDLFEVEYLKSFYCWAKDAAMMVTNKIKEYKAFIIEEKVCIEALEVMFQIMNWDFKVIESCRSSHNIRIKHDLKNFDRTMVQPGFAWYDVLISCGHIAWLLDFYGTLRKRFKDDDFWLDGSLASSCRQLIVQLCSLTGTIFLSDNLLSYTEYLHQMLYSIVEWIDPPDVIMDSINSGKCASEMLDGCHALFSIATLIDTTTFNNLLRPFGTLQLLSNLTFKVAITFGNINNDEQSHISEAMDILLETWSILLMNTNSSGKGLSNEEKNICARLFNSLMDSQLKAASVLIFESDNESEHFLASVSLRDERLDSICLIARAVADITLPFLFTSFSERLKGLCQIKNQNDRNSIFEELYWLILVSGHVLTDSGEGETILVPDAFLVQFPDVVEASSHPVIALSETIINFAEQSLNTEMRAFFNPRFMEVLVWFLGRWVNTYILPVESGEKYHRNTQIQRKQLSQKILLNYAGENNQGKHILHVSIMISIIALTSYPGQPKLQALTCQQLLPALVRRKNVCIQVVSLGSWNNLLNVFANDVSLFSLSSRLQRTLSETLIHSAYAINDSNLSNQYVSGLMGSTVKYLMDISQITKNDAKTVSPQPNIICWICCLLERLRGAVRAAEPQTQKAIFDNSVAVMNPLLSLMSIYKDEATVVYMILKYAVDLVEGNVVFLSTEDTRILIGFCLNLLEIYSLHNARKILLSLSPGLLNEAETEKYKDLSALLQLLSNLCSKDLVDFSSASDGVDRIDIGQVVYMGLHVVIPLMSSELLKYTKFSKKYFYLLSHIFEVYPEKTTQLKNEDFIHMIGTLDWGIRQQDIEVIEMCLRALNALASYHYKAKLSWNADINTQLENFQRPNEMSIEHIMQHFLHSLTHLLFLENFSMDLVGVAADALLPLLLYDREMYQKLVHDIVERQSNDLQKSRLSTAFNFLTDSNQLVASLDRTNRQRFRKNLQKLIIDVSGILRTN